MLTAVGGRALQGRAAPPSPRTPRGFAEGQRYPTSPVLGPDLPSNPGQTSVAGRQLDPTQAKGRVGLAGSQRAGGRQRSKYSVVLRLGLVMKRGIYYRY